MIMKRKKIVKDLWGRPYPGTFWDSCLTEPDLGHNRDYGHVCCRHCRGRYNDHGAPAGVATALGHPLMEKDRNLICNPDGPSKKGPKPRLVVTEYRKAIDRLAYLATCIEDGRTPGDEPPLWEQIARDIRRVLHGTRG